MAKGAGAVSVDAVILAGAVGHEPRWSGGVPRALLPLPGSTLIDTLLARLSIAVEGESAVCANGHTGLVRSSLAPRGGGTVHFYYEDRLPRGTAGCLKDCAKRLSAETIVLTGASVWLEDDLAWILDRHRAEGNVLTVCCAQQDAVSEWADHRVLKPAGLFICDRIVLDYIRPSGFQDLKEQTVPALQQAGLRVGALELRSGTCQVVDWRSYLRVIASCVNTGLFATKDYERRAPGVWVGRDVKIAPTARIAGPVFLGHGSRVADRAVVVGPVMLGDRCEVGPEAWVACAVGEPQIRVPAGARLVDRFVRQSPIPATLTATETILQGDTNWALPGHRFPADGDLLFTSHVPS